MKKNNTVTVCDSLLFLSCEKDDICDNTVTTALSDFVFDVTNSSILKNATNLK
jgi:hypothetical protein